ncbi:O-antigen ligase family protein [Niameybacter massiliensis]|uniref:O-antigen ligase family protein n=1 Tax=Holtiella tumoricola TaxID=3018743 RepID=A0AA42DQ78_9FIRM|nr:O-antigen ligase family protein [Holtiella tumoricola]MDA3733223.1 O-antigen ligase family protein [Holtiella tumoricola]
MIEKEKEVQGKYTFNFKWVVFIPIMLLLGVVPLMVRLVKTDIPAEYILYITGNNIDFFTQFKAQAIVALVIVMGVILFLTWKKEYVKKDKISYIYYGMSALFIMMTLLSGFLSSYREVTTWGLPNHAEGMVILVCYIVMMLYTYYCVKEKKDYKFILIPLAFLVVCTTVLGFFQYIGKDLFMTELGNKIIIPEHYAEDRGILTGLYESKRIYGTMFHYNYVGSFAAMMVPLFLTLTCLMKGYKSKLAFGFLSLCSLFLLFGSTSRAGLIGFACSIVVFIILFGRSFMKHWKGLVIAVVIGMISVIGLDMVTHGSIFSRVPALVADIKEMFQSAPQDFGYKSNLPIQDIIQKDGRITFKLKDKSLTVSMTEDGPKFEDEVGNEIVYIYMDLGQGARYFTQEQKFEDMIFHVRQVQDQYYLILAYQNTKVLTLGMSDEGIQIVDDYTYEPKELVEPPAIGFKGKERMGSARGYIWSRSLPLLKDTLFLGFGPDTYAFEFPQDDILGKWYAYDTPNMVVDKPHNLYLQIAINEGVIALIAFLVLVGTYIVHAIQLYGFKKGYSVIEILGSAVLLAIIGYLGAGMFNDSVVPVAPIFWILLGTGMATNFIVAKEQKGARAKMSHATINMKTRKHV